MKSLLIWLVLSPLLAAQMPYKNIRSKVPERATEYYANTNLRGGVKLTITARFDSRFDCIGYTCGDVYYRAYDGMLEQRDGKFVGFDPKNPADKVIDRDLIGWVQTTSAEAIREDTQYIKVAVEYTDESGQHWVKKGAMLPPVATTPKPKKTKANFASTPPWETYCLEVDGGTWHLCELK